MQNDMTTYRCTEKCPIHKRCFILKVQQPIASPLKVLQKCLAKNGKDIVVLIGGERPP